MKPVLIGLAVLIALAFIGVGCWGVLDATNIDVINPVPTQPPMNEIDLDAHQMDVQLAHQVDATGKIAAVAVAGYSTIAAMQGANTFRDVAFMAFVLVALYIVWQMRRGNSKK